VTEPPGRGYPRFTRFDFWICLILLAGTAGLYSNVRHFGFVNFDDPDYATAPQLREGFTADAVRWALTSTDNANWLPVTRLSHLLDYQLYGPQSGPAHVTSVAVHICACLLLYFFLVRAGLGRGGSAFAAVVFAWHPLHVESVAWVAERKDVICGFFWFLTLLLWVRYTEKPSCARYLAALLTFSLGLMSKPMIVTLPFVLLLVDFWPLRRAIGQRVLLEKAPFLALSAAGSTIAYLAQGRAGAVGQLETFRWALRVENSFLSYVVYLGKTLWPSNLAFWYPYPAAIPWWEAGACALAIAAVSAFAALRRRSRPWVITGWLWFVGTLIPVIGLVQVGSQARADRYMYVPMAGLLIAAAGEAGTLVSARPRIRRAAIGAGVAVCAALLAVSWRQIETWRDDRSFFTHAIKVTDGNYFAWNGLGVLDERTTGQSAQAYRDFDTARRIRPDFAPAWYNCGDMLMRTGELDGAQEDFEEALRLNPGYAQAHNNLGAVLGMKGRWKDAVEQLEKAVDLRPDLAEAWRNLGDALLKTGRFAQAAESLDRSLELNPNDAVAESMLGYALGHASGRIYDAIEHLRRAVAREPRLTIAHANLGRLLLQVPGGRTEAIGELQKALSLDPADSETRVLLSSLGTDQSR
jgi:tetratricopeptide (TPR) repeat protein